METTNTNNSSEVIIFFLDFYEISGVCDNSGNLQIYSRDFSPLLGFSEGVSKISIGLQFPKRRKLIVTRFHTQQLHLDWIKGLVEQVEFADRLNALPDYILHLKVAKRRPNQ